MYQRVFGGHQGSDDDQGHDDGLAAQPRAPIQKPSKSPGPDASTQLHDLLGIDIDAQDNTHQPAAASQQTSDLLLPLDPDDLPAPPSPNPRSNSIPSQQQPSNARQGIDNELQPELDPGEPESLLDFEVEDGSTAAQRELLLYALPLHQDDTDPVRGLVFLPVSNFHDDDDYDGVSGKMREKLDKLQSKVANKWDELKAKEQDSLGGKVYKVGHKVVNNLTPQERLTRSIPKNVTKVIIYHPAVISPDIIMERLSSITTDHGVMSTAKAAVATVMLPLAFGIDILIIPGPQVNSVVGNKRLTKYIAQSGEAKHVRVNYAGDTRLDPYWEEVQLSHDGVLDEEACMQLVNDIEQPDLLEPLLELRRRWIKEQGQVSSSGHTYQALRSSEYSTH